MPQTAESPSGAREAEDLKQIKALVKAMEDERADWEPHWRDLTRFLRPQSGRYGTAEHKRRARWGAIIDSTAGYCIDVAQAGMISGLANPARVWFQLTTAQRQLAGLASVNRWLEETSDLMRIVFLRSNLYQTLAQFFTDSFVFGMGAFLVEEDAEQVIHCHHWQIGSYALARSSRGDHDTASRRYRKTVRQMVNDYGLDAVSVPVREMYESGKTEIWREVVHVIFPNRDFREGAIGPRGKRWASVHYEASSTDKLLRRGGYSEFPVITAAWDTVGEDCWATGWGSAALGDVKMLQTMNKKALLAADKGLDPPLIGPPRVGATLPISQMPGAYNTESVDTGGQGTRALHEVQLRLDHVGALMQEARDRIRSIFAVDMWLMAAESDRRQITAREIQERHEEKMFRLGPTVDRMNKALGLLIDRTFEVLLRRGLLPEPPPELSGTSLDVEYVSIMAQAQKLAGVGALERLAGTVANLSGVVPQALDKVNWDEMVDQFADALGASPKVVYSEDEVAALRERRAQQQQAAAMANAMPGMARAAKDLSETDVEAEGSALSRLAAAMGGSGR